MEQQLNATYLKPGVMERAAAVGIAAAGIGTGILLAAWGISLLWRYTPPEIAVRVANPEIRVTQDKPFTIAPPPPLQIDPATPPLKIERPAQFSGSAMSENKTAAGDVIRREVTVFSSVEHAVGQITTGWNFRDGSGGAPVRQYCYYLAPNFDDSSTKIDIAYNGAPVPTGTSLVPQLAEALAKCQWWQG
jgi:hypothetical protein